jgi:biopolymer transport protein ExbB/TolQ
VVVAMVMIVAMGMVMIVVVVMVVVMIVLMGMVVFRVIKVSSWGSFWEPHSQVEIVFVDPLNILNSKREREKTVSIAKMKIPTLSFGFTTKP